MRKDVKKTKFGIMNAGKRYTGITKFLSKYHEPFDADAVAEKLSKKTGIEVNDYLAEWHNSAKEGTKTHEEIERIISQKCFDDKMGSDIKNIIDLAIYDAKLNGNWHSEMICFNDDFNIAGIADLVIINKLEKRFIVIDFKTTKKLRFQSFGNKKMFHPFESLDDCNYNHYQLQLNCYGLLLAIESGYQCCGMYIAHIQKSIYLYKVSDFFKILNNEMAKNVQ